MQSSPRCRESPSRVVPHPGWQGAPTVFIRWGDDIQNPMWQSLFGESTSFLRSSIAVCSIWGIRGVSGKALRRPSGQSRARASWPGGLASSVKENQRGQWVDSYLAKRSTSALPKTSQILSTTSGWSRHSFGGGLQSDRKSAARFCSPGICIALMLARRRATANRSSLDTCNNNADLVPSWWFMWEAVEMLSDHISTCLPLRYGRKSCRAMWTACSSSTLIWVVPSWEGCNGLLTGCNGAHVHALKEKWSLPPWRQSKEVTPWHLEFPVLVPLGTQVEAVQPPLKGTQWQQT